MSKDQSSDDIKLCLIVAMAHDRAIGKDNALLWHLPQDLKHFKNVTMGKPVIMGHKTWDSIVAQIGKGLPGRDNIVISRSGFAADGAYIRDTPKQGIRLAKQLAAEKGLDEVFIIGGATIYEQTLPDVDRIYLTMVEGEYEADAYFPKVNLKKWKKISAERHHGDPAFSFLVLERP